MKQETVDFLKLLVDTNRLDSVESIITVFEQRYNELTDTQVRPPPPPPVLARCRARRGLVLVRLPWRGSA